MLIGEVVIFALGDGSLLEQTPRQFGKTLLDRDALSIQGIRGIVLILEHHAPLVGNKNYHLSVLANQLDTSFKTHRHLSTRAN
jgi:hypothetical protein